MKTCIIFLFIFTTCECIYSQTDSIIVFEKSKGIYIIAHSSKIHAILDEDTLKQLAPFGPTTKFNFNLTEKSSLNIQISDTSLQSILLNINLTSLNVGDYSFYFNGLLNEVSSGVYFITINLDYETIRKKFVLIK